MLFSFNYFWKALLVIVGSWLFYGLWGFEFTVVTQIALLVAFHFKADSFIV